MLKLYIIIAACTVPLVLVCGLYGALESIKVLRRLRIVVTLLV